MNRCTFPWMAALLLALSAGLSSLPATAQTEDAPPKVREFPKEALRGVMVVLAPPEVSMDGKPDRLAPGARLRDSSNQFVFSGALLNQPLVVNYLRDNTGLVHQVWILSSDEARLKRPNSQTSFFNVIFGSSENPAPKDDGKTPFDQLPAFKP